MKYDFLDTDVLARLGAIPLESRFPMVGNVAGRHRSPHRGSSVEFAEYRKYVPGDDTRRLDWKAYARSDRYYIKEFEADTNLRAYFVVDTSGSMDFTSGENPSKIDFAKKIAATLAYLIVNQGDSAGLSCCSEKLHLEIPPSRRAAQLQHIFETLKDIEPTGETGLVHALAARRARGIVVDELHKSLLAFVPLHHFFPLGRAATETFVVVFLILTLLITFLSIKLLVLLQPLQLPYNHRVVQINSLLCRLLHLLLHFLLHFLLYLFS